MTEKFTVLKLIKFQKKYYISSKLLDLYVNYIKLTKSYRKIMVLNPKLISLKSNINNHWLPVMCSFFRLVKKVFLTYS